MIDRTRQPKLPDTLSVKILRQDGPGKPSYWEVHKVPREPNMNITTVLMRIAEHAQRADGEPVAPVAYEVACLEEVCGSCSMLINGQVRQGCSALVDRLLEEQPGEIELRPMTKFPVVRDLVVDRTRMFDALKKLHAWIDVDGYYDAGPGPRVPPKVQQERYPLSECMSCGCCLEACPQYTKIELLRREGETEQQFEARRRAEHDRGFIGAAAISQVVLFNADPTGANQADVRLDALMSEGGIQQCGNAQNCVAVCPKHIPLTTSIAKAGRATTVRAIKKFFEG